MGRQKAGLVTIGMFLLFGAVVWAGSIIDLKDTGGGITPQKGTSGAAHVSMGGTSLAYIATATTTQVKTGAGFLHCITVNTTAAGTIGIIDNTAGTTVNIGQLKASVAEGTYCYDVPFTTGLRIVTAAASNLTISYR